MSQFCSLKVVSAEDFARLQTDPDYVPHAEGMLPYTLNSGWVCFHEIFRDEPGPLRHILQGDFGEESIQRLFLSEEEGGDATFFGYVTPNTVLQIAEALRAMPRWEWMATMRKHSPAWVRHKADRDARSETFDQLLEAYTAAAGRGAALSVLVC